MLLQLISTTPTDRKYRITWKLLIITYPVPNATRLQNVTAWNVTATLWYIDCLYASQKLTQCCQCPKNVQSMQKISQLFWVILFTHGQNARNVKMPSTACCCALPRLGLAIVPLCRGTGAPSTNTGAPWPLTVNITSNYQ